MRNRKIFIQAFKYYLGNNPSAKYKSIYLFKKLIANEKLVDKKDLSWAAFFLAKYYYKIDRKKSLYYYNKAVSYNPGNSRLKKFLTTHP